MTQAKSYAGLFDIVRQFEFRGTPESMIPYGNGHINDTYLLQTGEGELAYILQRMNPSVFKSPRLLMENITGITTFLRHKIETEGGDPDRGTLTFFPTHDGRSYYIDESGIYWRLCYFIRNTVSYDRVMRPEHFYQSARAFGHFQKQLSDYPAHTLHETIPDFHNTPARYERFERAVSSDRMNRAEEVRKEIEFLRARKEFTHTLTDMQADGRLPLRVTHNDTKLNNVLFDQATGEAVCVIDLDTVMPGLSVNDFGDSIRFGANTGAEDEQDLSRVSCDTELFRLYTKGFLEGCDGSLTKNEIAMLPAAAKMMTLESGIRFLTDYLEGDVYFKIHRPGHNLDRCRAQLKLVADMEEKRDVLEQIVKELS